MSRDAYRGPKLPQSLLNQVENGSGSRGGRYNVSRKDRRQAERQQKKSLHSRTAIAAPKPSSKQHPYSPAGDDADADGGEEGPSRTPKLALKASARRTEPGKSILKKRKNPAPSPPAESEDEDDAMDFSISSRAAANGLAEDDAEIAALEKKLGVKGGKPKAREEEGLDWLADGSEDGSEGEGSGRELKRKRPEDGKWLRDKRLKAGRVTRLEHDGHEDSTSPDLLSEDASDGSVDVFEGFSSDDGAEMNHTLPLPRLKQRENPYVAPVPKGTAPVARYVPPSLRAPAASDEEALKQLRRQLQGLLNRLSEANVLSILSSLTHLYTKNARQHVTSALVDLLIALVSDPSPLNDTFLILHAGFSTSVHKTIGTDFGAHLLEKLVESFDHHRNSTTPGKQTLNIIAFLSSLYTFQLTSSDLLFDYIRLLLSSLSETNTELLLRTIRTSGQQLRSDDPRALKDIALRLQRSVADVGEDNLSVRTKFMIETIHNLKNNRMKSAAAGASALAAEHTARIKKVLASLNQSHSGARVTQPLCITLWDLRNAEKKGKWWLVGASWNDPHKLSNGAESGELGLKARQDEEDAGYESETPGSVNVSKLARSQGMNTVSLESSPIPFREIGGRDSPI